MSGFIVSKQIQNVNGVRVRNTVCIGDSSARVILSEDPEKPSLLLLAASSIVLHGEDLLITVCFFCKLLLSNFCSLYFFYGLLFIFPLRGMVLMSV